ncbi:putative disease resistance protein RGA3 [Typha latifolia]|uniref:putative disease resistance protein RGA3 n=1 Tax=Typha latifolia TaxID=4733 RepID=UPI003C2D342C
MSTVGKILMGSATPFFLKGLGATDYWELFKECAFLNEDPNDHEKLQEIGRRIVEKLKGSPLAAKTVGGILNSRLDYQHWLDILNSEIWELEQDENDIMPALRLSYQYLPSHLKPCFTYCSIFPPDCELDKENLVYLWVALGLVEQPISGKRQPEEIANEYFNYLLKKSFFDCRDLDKDPFYVMHDLLHELAQFVSQGECWRVISGKKESIPNAVRHLSVDILSMSKLQISNLKNLRTLLLLDGDDSERCYVNLEMFKMLKSLRVLIIPPESTVTSLECIVDLIHLRFLSLDYSSITHAYKSVNRLYHLQFMRFTPPYFGYPGDSPLKRPVCFNLVNLRHLIMPGNTVANISGIGRLTSLQNLKAFRVEEEDGHKICELKDLRQLRELSIQNLENITNVKEVQESNLKNKNHLHTLSLEWDSFGAPEFVEQVLDCLEPHSNLRVLRIKGYMGLSCPRWLTTSSFSELESIVFSCCKGLEVLPPLDQLPYLKSLCLEDMHAVKQVGYRSNERFADSIFPSLEALDISNCDLLEEWYGQAGTTQWFPCLRKLRVSGCPNLKVLSPLPCSLRELDIGDVALGALPKLWQGGRSNHVSLLTSSSLASLTVQDCSSLVTIGEGLLLHPELFTALQTLSISRCPELKYLPVGGFRKLIFLTKLVVKWCPEMQRSVTSESFLPSSLRSLIIDSCDHLDVMLSKDLWELTFLSSLELRCSPNITSLRTLEVLGRWKALQSLSIDTCPKLASLEGLQALCPLMFLKIRCSRSVAAALLPSALPNELANETAVENPSSMLGGHEIERSLKLQHFSFARTLLRLLQRLVALLTLIYSAIRIFSRLCVPTSSQPLPLTADVSKRAVEGSSSLSIDRLHINDLSLLCAMPLRNLSSRVVTIEISYELQSSLEQWMLQNRTSLQELIIFSMKSKQFPPVDLQSLSCLQNLIIHNASSLQSLPILPLSLKVLRIIRCHPMLEMRCLKDSGPDWPKLSHIPTVCIGSYNKGQLETIAAAEHSTRGFSTT